MKASYYYVLVILTYAAIFFSCAKTPQIVQETLIVQDTVFVTKIDTLIVAEIKDAATFFFVRHAEKNLTGANPNLTEAGKDRANELARLLGEIQLDAVYSTNYNRTIETATPTATAQNIEITIYDPSALNKFGEELIKTYPKGKVLIVGHSNTTPQLINSLTTSTDFPNLSEKQYDDLFIMSLYEKGKAEVLNIKYGN